MGNALSVLRSEGALGLPEVGLTAPGDMRIGVALVEGSDKLTDFAGQARPLGRLQIDAEACEHAVIGDPPVGAVTGLPALDPHACQARLERTHHDGAVTGLLVSIEVTEAAAGAHLLRLARATDPAVGRAHLPERIDELAALSLAETSSVGVALLGARHRQAVRAAHQASHPLATHLGANLVSGATFVNTRSIRSGPA